MTNPFEATLPPTLTEPSGTDLFTVSAAPTELLAASLKAGRARRASGNFTQAAEHYETALALARELADTQSEADILNLQAGVSSALGNHRQALEQLEQALGLVQDARMEEQQANILNNLGTLHTLLGNYPQALESLKAAHDLLRRVAPGTRSAASNLINLGALYQELGNDAEATAFFIQAIEVAQGTDEPLMAAAALNNLANAYLGASNWTAAAEGFQQALEISREAGAKEYEIDNLDGLGQVYVALGDFEQATAVHLSVLEAAQKISYREGECDALLNLGRDFLATEHFDKALETLHTGLTLAEQVQRQTSVYRAHELLATAYEQLGDTPQALYHFRAFYQAEKTLFNEENERQVRKLAVQFDTERARHEAEEQRLQGELMRRARDEAEAMVKERTRELEEAQLEIVTRLAVAAEYRDDNTGEHTKRVGRNAAAIAHALGWPKDEVQLLFTASRLHDVGKIGVSDTILHKPGKLAPDEMALMKSHATIGARILAGGHSRLLSLAEEIALSHHERWDGKGYPLGLVGETIPLSARIVAVADVLDALTHERPYKRAWSVPEALAEVGRQSGYHFDPRVVAACFTIFGPSGTLSSTDHPADWHATFQDLQTSLPAPERLYQPEMASDSVARLKRLLQDKTQELEVSRREAQAASLRMQEMAFTDPLTGLHNRRAFEADLEAEAARALHQGDHLSILNLDLDLLKLVNDMQGHERGDALLCTFAHILSRHLQNHGKLYRIGGDEFTAILVHTSTKHFAEVRTRLAQAMDEVRAAGFPGVSVSAGIVALPEEVCVAGDLVRLSDQRMYEDKLEQRRVRQNDLTWAERDYAV